MIVSASRRTDIPAVYSEWFYRRLKKGFVLQRNPYNPLQVGRVILSPDQVDGFVFWTKNAAPMLDRIGELDGFKYYFQYTITPYGSDVERNIPDKNEVVIPAFRKIGADKTIWRYDPIFISSRYTKKYHENAFEKMAAMLEGSTSRCVISFVDYYRSVNLAALGITPITESEQKDLAHKLSEIARRHGITLTTCAENLGLPKSSCVDASMFGLKKNPDKSQRGGCQCDKSVDIGTYSTCTNRCAYCYANHYGQTKFMQDMDSDILGLPLNGHERIKDRN